MGVEVNLQAVPEDHDLVAWARNSRSVRDSLPYLTTHHRIWKTTGRITPPKFATDESRKYDAMILALVEDYPILLNLTCSPDKKHDILHYLLSENRRKLSGSCCFSRDSNISKVLYGEEPLCEEDQYFGISSTRTTNNLADWLLSIKLDEYASNLDYEIMKQHGVYKISPTTTLNVLGEAFNEIRDLYVGSSHNNMAVLAQITT